MTFRNLITAVLLSMSAFVFAQTPALDQLGGGGIVYLDAAPTWTRTATDAAFSFDVLTEILYYNGGADATWTVLNMTPLDDVLTSGSIFVGNGSNVATGVAMSGAVAITNAGVTTLTTSAISDQVNGLDLSISAGAIQTAYDFTEGTLLGTTPAAGDILYIYDLSTTTHVPVAYSDLVPAAGTTLYSGDGTITNVTRTVTFTNGTTTDLIFTDGTNTLMTLTDAGTTGTLAITGNTTVGLDLTVTGNDIIFGNAETISNATDGTVLITSPITALSAALTVAGDATLGDAAGDVVTINSDAPVFTNLQGFASKTAAEAALGTNVLYYLTAVNTHGLPAGVAMIAL